MAVGHQLSFGGQPLKRPFFKMRFVSIDVVEYFRLQDEERAVDPAFFGLILFGKLDYVIAVHLEMPETGCRPNGGERRQLSVRFMKREQLV